MNNTKIKPNKNNQKIQEHKTRHGQGAKKQSGNANVLHGNLTYHEQERPETRMTR